MEVSQTRKGQEERFLRDSLEPSWSKKPVSSLACTTSFHAVPLPLPHPPWPVFHSGSQIMSFPLGEGGSNAPPTSISALSFPTLPPTTFLTGPQACLAQTYHRAFAHTLPVPGISSPCCSHASLQSLLSPSLTTPASLPLPLLHIPFPFIFLHSSPNLKLRLLSACDSSPSTGMETLRGWEICSVQD